MEQSCDPFLPHASPNVRIRHSSLRLTILIGTRPLRGSVAM